jgi:hypothetical protein
MITTTTAIIALISLASIQYHGVAVALSVLLAVLGIAKTALTRLIRNEPLIERIDAAIQDAAPAIEAIHRAAIAITRHAHATPPLTTVPPQPPASQPGPGAQPNESEQ